MPNCSHHHVSACNHYHFPQQNQWLLGCLKLTPGTDAIGDPRNLLRYPANLTQASRVVFSGVRGLEVVAPAVSLLPPIVYFGYAVGALAMFLSVAFINSVNKYTEIQGVVKSFQSLTSTDSQEPAHKQHHHLPRPIQALFHLPDSGYRYLAERIAPQDPQTLAKLKTCLFYANLALTTTITALGVVALVGGVGAVAATPVGWALMGLAVASTATFIAYSAVKNKYTTLSRQAYQEAFHLNEETKKKLQGQNIKATCETYGLLEPSQVVTQSFSSYLGLNKPKKVLNACFGKHQQQSEKPTSVSEILLNSALLNFAVTSQIEENEKKAIIDSAKQKFKARDNHSGSIDKKTVDSNQFLYELSTFLAEQEIEILCQNDTSQIKEKFAFLDPQQPESQNKGCVAKVASCFSQCLPRFKPKPKEYYDKNIRAQTMLAVTRKAKENKEANHQNCDGHGHSHGHGHGHEHNCGGHSHGNGHGHGHGHSHSHIHSHIQEHQHCGDCCGAKQEYQEPTNLQHFKEQVPSFANPNLYNGNKYLGRLNERLFGEGSEDYKLTLQGIKELAKQFADNKTSLVSEIAELITTTKTGENMMQEKNTAEARKEEAVPPPPQVGEQKRQRRQQGAGAGNGEPINLVDSYNGDPKCNRENCTEEYSHGTESPPEKAKQGASDLKSPETSPTPVLVEEGPNTAPQTTSFWECLINPFAYCRG